MKLLLWAVLIFAVIWVLRSKKSSQSSGKNASAQSPSENREVEAMLRCTHCGTYFPASEAVRDASDMAFCSGEHRRQHSAH